MKLSVSLSTVLLILPAIATAFSVPRGLNGDVYMPRNHARQFGRQGRQRQGGFRQGGNRGGNNNNNNANQGQVSSSASATQAGQSNASTESCPAPTTVTVTASAAATNTAANQNQNGGNNGNGNNGNNNGATATSTSAAADVSATVVANNGQNNNNNNGQNNQNNGQNNGQNNQNNGQNNQNNGQNNNNGGNNNNNNNDPNTSLTLLANLVAPGLANDGQDVPVDGQVSSLTSTNNFINFCAGKTITNGQQITGGSCNPIPLGDIIPKANMPKCKFANPVNGATIAANTPFQVQMNIQNMQAGVFTNAQKTYYMAPQQLNGQGILIGHTHFVIQAMGDFADPSILDAGTFAFFKGVNTAAQNGQLTADVTAGLPAGNYRLASINTSSNHAPAVAAVAQHGLLDDMVYFKVQ